MWHPYIRIRRLEYAAPHTVPILASQSDASVRFLYAVMELYPSDYIRRLRVIAYRRPMRCYRFIACESPNLPRFVIVNLSDSRYHRINAVATNDARADDR